MEKHGDLTPEQSEHTYGSSNGAGAPRKAGFGTRLKHFLKKFWWALLILLIIIVLVVVLPIIYVAYPHTAQKGINDSELEIKSQNISDPKVGSFHMTLSSLATSHSSFHPKLDSFNASLFLESSEPDIKPFAYMQIPAVKADDETTIDIDQELQIADMDQFIAYNKLVVNSEQYRMAIRGRVKVKQSGLPKTTVNYNKVVTMKGLNRLSGLNITSTKILLDPESDGTNMLGNVTIPNPSVMAVNMGNVTLDLSVAGLAIGSALIPNLQLNPGDNHLQMRTIANQTTVLKLVMGKYTNGILPIDVIGNSSINAAGDHLPYFEQAIRENTLHMNVDVGTALAAIGINITSLGG